MSSISRWFNTYSCRLQIRWKHILSLEVIDDSGARDFALVYVNVGLNPEFITVDISESELLIPDNRTDPQNVTIELVFGQQFFEPIQGFQAELEIGYFLRLGGFLDRFPVKVTIRGFIVARRQDVVGAGSQVSVFLEKRTPREGS